MADTLQSVVTSIQAEIGDPDGALYTNPKVKVMVIAAQKELVLKLRAWSVERVRRPTVTLSLGANVTSLTTASTPPLPTDFSTPIVLWEAAAGGAANTYIPMLQVEQLPALAPTQVLGYWAFFAGQIRLIGATTARDVHLDYWGKLSDPTYPTDVLAIVGSELALTALTKRRIVESQGDLVGGRAFQDEAERYMHDIATEHSKVQQGVSTRRAPMWPRSGGYGRGYYGGGF